MRLKLLKFCSVMVFTLALFFCFSLSSFALTPSTTVNDVRFDMLPQADQSTSGVSSDGVVYFNMLDYNLSDCCGYVFYNGTDYGLILLKLNNLDYFSNTIDISLFYKNNSNYGLLVETRSLSGNKIIASSGQCITSYQGNTNFTGGMINSPITSQDNSWTYIAGWIRNPNNNDIVPFTSIYMTDVGYLLPTISLDKQETVMAYNGWTSTSDIVNFTSTIQYCIYNNSGTVLTNVIGQGGTDLDKLHGTVNGSVPDGQGGSQDINLDVNLEFPEYDGDIGTDEFPTMPEFDDSALSVIDGGSALQWVYARVNDLVVTNQKIFALVTSCLSLGVIMLILNKRS